MNNDTINLISTILTLSYRESFPLSFAFNKILWVNFLCQDSPMMSLFPCCLVTQEIGVAKPHTGDRLNDEKYFELGLFLGLKDIIFFSCFGRIIFHLIMKAVH